jgi:hypothetical protein
MDGISIAGDRADKARRTADIVGAPSRSVRTATAKPMATHEHQRRHVDRGRVAMWCMILSAASMLIIAALSIASVDPIAIVTIGSIATSALAAVSGYLSARR